MCIRDRSIVFGIFATAMTVMQLWFEILKFSNSTSFGIDDPLFGLDISFYIFRFDFLTQLNEILIGVIMGFIILTVIYYIILMAVRTPDVFKEEVPPDARYAGPEEEYNKDNPFTQNKKKTAKNNDFFGKDVYKRQVPYGRYILSEISAPGGYEKAGEISVGIVSPGETREYDIVNSRIPMTGDMADLSGWTAVLVLAAVAVMLARGFNLKLEKRADT